MPQWMRSISCLMMLLGLTALTGCGLDAGFNKVPEIPIGPVQTRLELESVPNAQLVRENTMPTWQLGRYAFKRGADRLIVVSQFTTFGKVDKETQKVVDLKDWGRERVWITIPAGTRLGQELDLEDLEYHHLVGYDFGEVAGKDSGQYIEPFRVQGKLAVVEEKKDSIVVWFDMTVDPERRPKWGISKEFRDIPLTAQGINATYVRPGPAAMFSGQAEVSPAPASTTQPAPATPTTITTPPATQPARATAIDPTEATIVGAWIFQDGNRWYDRIQFTSDRQYVYANCRGGNYEPALHAGTWEIKNGFIVLTCTRETFDALDPTGKRDLLKQPTAGYLRARFDGDALLLDGQMQNRGSVQPFARKLVRGDYADMRFKAPPRMK